jgi:membrane protease YdiL (CAAX protease family)
MAGDPGMAPLNPWLMAGIGLAQTAGVLAVMIGFGALVSALARIVIRRPRDQWRMLRVDRFWLVNMILSPFSFALFAALAWLLHLTPHDLGLNADHLWLSLGVGLGLAVLLGSMSAFASVAAAKMGVSPMQIAFGRSLADVIGAIAYTAIFVGPLEEIPFRGLIQTILMRAMPQATQIGPVTMLLGTPLAAIIFVIYHFRNVQMGGETRGQFFRAMPGRVIASLVLALLFQSTGSLLGPILFHNVVDTCTITALSVTMYRLRRQGRLPSPWHPPAPPPVIPPAPIPAPEDAPPGEAPQFV